MLTSRVSPSRPTSPLPTRCRLSTVAGFIGDAFVAKLNPAGSALVYSTYLGGSGDDRDLGSRWTPREMLTSRVTPIRPTSPPPARSKLSIGGGDDAFVAKLNPAGSALVYSTYLGGSGGDGGNGIAVDSAGNAYVTGDTHRPTSPLPARCRLSWAALRCLCGEAEPAGFRSRLLHLPGWQQARRWHWDSGGLRGKCLRHGATTSTDFPTASPLRLSTAAVKMPLWRS